MEQLLPGQITRLLPPCLRSIDFWSRQIGWSCTQRFVNGSPETRFKSLPILLDSRCDRCGPTSFRFELMWLEEQHCPALVRDWWKEIPVEGWACYKVAMKLKLLKGRIKDWSKEHFGDVRTAKKVV